MNDDGPGEKPKGIDPDEVVSRAELEGLGEAVVGAVERPQYHEEQQRELVSSTPREPSRIKEKGDIVEATFEPTTTVPDYLRGTFEQLGAIQKWLHGRDLQKIQRAQIKRLTRELFEYQYKDMQHLMMLGMDIQKKQRFAQYLASTRSLQNEIQQQSAEAQLAVIDTLFDNMIEAFKNKNNRDIELAQLFKQGVIDQRQFDSTSADNDRYIRDHIKKIDETAKTMIMRHGEFLRETLELFQTKLIGAGHL